MGGHDGIGIGIGRGLGSGRRAGMASVYIKLVRWKWPGTGAPGCVERTRGKGRALVRGWGGGAPGWPLPAASTTGQGRVALVGGCQPAAASSGIVCHLMQMAISTVCSSVYKHCWLTHTLTPPWRCAALCEQQGPGSASHPAVASHAMSMPCQCNVNAMWGIKYTGVGQGSLQRASASFYELG